MPLWAGMLAAFAAGVAQKADFVQSRLEKRPVATAHAVCSGVIACHVCNWSAAEGRFCAIVAGKMPLLAGMLATFAIGVPQKAGFVQSRPGRCPFWPECLPRLQLECRRRWISCNRGQETPRCDCSRCMLRCDSLPRLQLECRRRPISCNRGRENAFSGRNACHVCSWSGAEGRFHAIAAGKMPLSAGMLAAFAAGVPQKADFMQSRQAKRLLSASETPSFGQRNVPSACKNYPRG